MQTHLLASMTSLGFSSYNIHIITYLWCNICKYVLCIFNTCIYIYTSYQCIYIYTSYQCIYIYISMWLMFSRFSSWIESSNIWPWHITGWLGHESGLWCHKAGLDRDVWCSGGEGMYPCCSVRRLDNDTDILGYNLGYLHILYYVRCMFWGVLYYMYTNDHYSQNSNVNIEKVAIHASFGMSEVPRHQFKYFDLTYWH